MYSHEHTGHGACMLDLELTLWPAASFSFGSSLVARADGETEPQL